MHVYFSYQAISTGIMEKHRPLLPGLACEPDVRLNHKGHALAPQPVRKLVELIHSQGNPKVWHWDRITIHLVGRGGCVVIFDKMCYYLSQGNGARS